MSNYRISGMQNEVQLILRRLRRNITPDITDKVFLYIQNNNNILGLYNRAGGRTLNAAIGRDVRVTLGLQNHGRNHNPKSKLIQSYMMH